MKSLLKSWKREFVEELIKFEKVMWTINATYEINAII